MDEDNLSTVVYITIMVIFSALVGAKMFQNYSDSKALIACYEAAKVNTNLTCSK